MDLSAFRSRRALDALTVGAVGASLAAATAAVFRLGFSGGGENMVLITALPTLLLGTLWAVLLRWRATLSKSKLRVGSTTPARSLCVQRMPESITAT